MSIKKNIFNIESKFLMSVANLEQLPKLHISETAFIGKSNVGKSSLINKIFNKKIALTSKTPGRTRQLNFFIIENKISIVDMPGYGYAKISKSDISNWRQLTFGYFSIRKNLKRVFLLFDIRKVIDDNGIDDRDFEMMDILNSAPVSFQIILTKSDQVKKEEYDQIKNNLMKKLQKYSALYPEIIISSSKYGNGIDNIKEQITNLC